MRGTTWLWIVWTVIALGLRAAAQTAPATPPPGTQPAAPAATKPAEAEKPLSADTFAGLTFRCLGPALQSGRVADLAVDPHNRARYYVAVASGNVWKTTNAGTTWTPVFDDQGSFSIGCLALDPRNVNVLWVGTGENNSQRSVAFGDGVYVTRDGGQSWTNTGLRESEHIGKILIDPRDSNVVYVAAQGPLWRDGGDRGLYKTTDGGATWTRILHVSDQTGINEVHCDPRDPDTLYATAYQRRRHIWTLINGGPEGAFYKSTDAGQRWRKVTRGLPEGDLGRIGLAVVPTNPDILYAIVEATEDKGGIFRSVDRGESWEKRCGYQPTSPQYYCELVPHPTDPNTFYSLDTFLHVTHDGGKTMTRITRQNRHVDDHALWIDPHAPDYHLLGCDGGVYESFDAGATWKFMSNLPVTQFYRVAVDNSVPFYYVYGGTQDNATPGGPSRTTDALGIGNEHWFLTVGGDGFEPAVDPTNPNIVYAQWQYGGLVRHDRASGETLDIRPSERPGDPPDRWNWDSPLQLSPHDPHRLYFASQRVWRSDDRGASWTPISGDLTKQLDRDALKVFGKIQRPEAVAKHNSTSPYGKIVALQESPLVEGLIYVGTDDGLLQVTEDGGQNWRKITNVPGAPELAYAIWVLPSRHAADRVYAAFDNHKLGDFKPYLFVSQDRGQTWTSIVSDLPERGMVYNLQEDHVQADLLFVATEFGVHFTIDGGKRWMRLKGGLPTISVQDMDIQRRENDLVLATFGRGFYVLDDYSPLRYVSDEALDRPALLFPVKDAWRYVERARLGGRNGKGSQGDAYYAAANPPFGAVFTYYLKDKLETRKERRQKAEEKAEQANASWKYPQLDEFRAEDLEREPQIILTVADDTGAVVRRISGPRDKGIHRVAWDLRYPAPDPVDLTPPGDQAPWWEPPVGPLALPGTYTVTLSQVVDGVVTRLAEPQAFDVVPLELATLPARDKAEVLAFQRRAARLQRAVAGAIRLSDEAANRLNHLWVALKDTPDAKAELLERVTAVQLRLAALQRELRGDPSAVKRETPQVPSIAQRSGRAISQWGTTSAPTQTQRDDYRFAAEAFAKVLPALKQLVTQDVAQLEAELERLGAPWTPGRLPVWEPE